MAFTSIEGGPNKVEFGERRVRVEYNAKALSDEARAAFSDEQHLDAITAARNRIVSALLHVIQRAMQLRRESTSFIPYPKGYDRFKGNYYWLVFLLRAFAELAGKPSDWADSIIKVWNAEMSRETSEASDPLEYPLLQYVQAHRIEGSKVQYFPHVHQGRRGTLFLLQMEDVHFWLRSKPEYRDAGLPLSPSALGRRMRNAKFHQFVVLDEDTHAKKIPAWKNLNKARRTGLFLVDE